MGLIFFLDASPLFSTYLVNRLAQDLSPVRFLHIPLLILLVRFRVGFPPFAGTYFPHTFRRAEVLFPAGWIYKPLLTTQALPKRC